MPSCRSVSPVPASSETNRLAVGMSPDRDDPPGYLTDDLQLRFLAGPPSYRHATDKPVDYISVSNPVGVVVGFIYANDDDDVVAWLPRRAAGHEAHSSYYPWMVRLRDCKVRGLRPSLALEELIAVAGVDGTQVVAGPRQHAASLVALKAIADS